LFDILWFRSPTGWGGLPVRVAFRFLQATLQVK
jgi:hypothetical protein